MKIIKIDYNNPDPEIIKKIAAIIKAGEMALVPGDAVYTLVGDATNSEVIRKINRIKKREKGKAFNLGLYCLSDIEKYAYFDERILRIQEKFPDEPFTFVTKRKVDVLPGYLNPGYNKLGFRIPFNRVTSMLSKYNRTPVIGTSANVSGCCDSHTPSEVIAFFKRQFGEELCPKIFLDAGNLKKRKPSTVVDVTEREIKVLRKGELNIEEFYKIINKNLNV